ncbi:16S rRNA (cytidine(1402)-2'-O)-methyltransferase [Sandaracinobacter sp. RS1-74]|uniref:16S rRNA (cytidine(1402)-2'-O)-methyltransferase n=1 Tax=Sandaracinobacteroides sayramensis TaxID=2913411 RepID=UPI001EDB304B|nr:16S rRNA (cytidine(1402)-2'-O)-methyltransferase [Sandaracinobacteroides sayramensis]MCG2841849.1 16S rRNA (cytidine(1402)-2'-O)-methyltransferase [Sandaracinobacteroides sayramensis]
MRSTPPAVSPSDPLPEGRLEPGLYIVAGPIGNLEDLSPRAARFLRQADLVACEDTRVTAKLLRAAGSDRPMLAYHDHSPAEVEEKLLARMAHAAVALVSDAGTPLVSDPGMELVRAARDRGIAVTTAPGPSAAIAALSISGLPSDRFLFAGFLPAKAAARDKAIAGLAGVPATLIFYESGPRLAATLVALARAFGPRQAAVARELTKRHEEYVGGALDELAARFAGEEPKGEIVLLVGPPAAEVSSAEALDQALKAALQTLPAGKAAASVAAALGVPRGEVYARALELKGGQ